MDSRRAVLIVDANREIAALVSSIFSSGQWNVENVASNAAALPAVRAGRFDIVLTSEKTGAKEDLDLLRRIRRINPHTRVIILADRGAPADVVDAMRENAFSYFTAPYALDQLKDMLRIAMDAPPWDDGIELRAATPKWIQLFVRCDFTTADRLVQFVNEIAEDLPYQEKSDLGTAFREMLLNAIEHGGHFNPKESVEITYLRSGRAVSCRIRDPGKGFSLEELPHAAISNPPEDPLQHLAHREKQGLRPGGLGVLITRQLVDELIYNERGNEVILIKYLDGARAGEASTGSA
jgi:anti-sigma regulatory factor (Ser/Thr protein kinase)/ActR/RegA family two-component response regulator